MTGDVRVVVHDAAIEDLLRDPGVRRGLMEQSFPVVSQARGRAPKNTGRGAASIRAEPVLDGPEWTVRISWDREHFYMYFKERGTQSLPPRPFLVPTLEGLA